MAKRKKHKPAWGLSFWKWVNVVGVTGGLIALIVTCVNYLNNQLSDLDHRIEMSDRRWEESIRRLDKTMAEVKAELKKTCDLLNADMSWRYLYQHDPTWKNFAPRYQPDTRTLEFVDTSVVDKGVRKP